MTYFGCKGCGMWESTELRDCYTLRGKSFCDNCYNKLIDKFPELADLDWNDSNSTWQVSEEEYARTRGLPIKKEIRVNWKKVIPATFGGKM